MRRSFYPFISGFFLLAGGCGKPEATPGALEQAHKTLPRSPLCSPVVPADWVSTWPIPTGGKAGAEYVALFYSLDRSAQDATGMPRVRVTRPRARAVFSADGAVSICEALGNKAKPLAGERYSAAVMQMEEDESDKATTRLLRLTEQVSAAYAGKKTGDQSLLSGYWKQFQLVAEPALWPDYYNAQPAFWDWLGRESGERLPPGR